MSAHCRMTWMVETLSDTAGRRIAMPTRSEMLRIASELPVGDPTRRKLLVAIRTARYNWRDVGKMDADEAMEAVEAISERVGHKAKEFIRHTRIEIREKEQYIKGLERAWSKWDWDALVSFNIVTKDEAEFAAEVLASYT